MKFGRRNLLKGMGIAPLAVGAASLGGGIAGPTAPGNIGLGMQAMNYVAKGQADYAGALKQGPRTFAEWLLGGGEESLRREAKYVHSLDPDIQGFALPLQTKVRMQHERNYMRLLSERKAWWVDMP